MKFIAKRFLGKSSRPVPFALACSLALLSLPLQAQSFLDATSRLENASGPTTNPLGAAALDFNNDGRVDLMLAGQLYLQGVEGRFRLDRDAGSLTHEDNLAVTAWGDFTGDGFLDALSMEGKQPFPLFTGLPEGGYMPISAPVVSPSTVLMSATWADFNSDGALDLYVGAGLGEHIYLRNERGAALRDERGSAGLNTRHIACTAAAADYDQDGDQDLYLGVCQVGDPVPQRFANLFYRNNGGGRFTEVGAALGVNVRDLTVTVAWFDYDNDGWLDLFLLNTGSPNRLYRNDGKGGFQDVTLASGMGGGSAGRRGLAVADFDNDGWQDVFTGGGAGGRSAFYHNNGDGTFTEALPATGLPSMDVTAAAAADFDGDGHIDLAMHAAGRNLLYLNAGAAGRWLSVGLQSSTLNRAAVGAVVEVVIGGRRQVQLITAGDGWEGAENGLTAHFGLGTASHVDALTIRWPGGTAEQYERVPANQVVLAVQGAGLQSWPRGPLQYAPADGTIFAPKESEILLEWEAPGGTAPGTTYSVYLSPRGDSVRVIGGLSTPSLRLPTGTLKKNQDYEWTVTRQEGQTVRRTTERFHFRYGEPQIPEYNLILFPLPGLSRSTLAFSDFDKDNDLDLLMVGKSSSGTIARIYRLDDSLVTREVGEGTITLRYQVYRDMQTIFEIIPTGKAAWAYESPGRARALLLTGLHPLSGRPTSVLYEYGEQIFRNVHTTAFPQMVAAALVWGDYDGDGDPDLIMTGATTTGPNPSLSTYLVEWGSERFMARDTGLPGLSAGTLAWGDIDGDGDLDLLLSGNSNTELITRLYRNDGGVFNEIPTPFPRLAFSSADFGDYDGDGDVDLLLAGGRFDPQLVRAETYLFRNENGHFIEVAAGFRGVLGGKATWNDFDNDGDLDVYLMGLEHATRDATLTIYRNIQGRYFEEDVQMTGLRFGDMAIGDFNGDGDVDLFEAGENMDGVPTLKVFLNQLVPDLIPPSYRR